MWLDAASVGLKIRVSVVRFRPWQPNKKGPRQGAVKYQGISTARPDISPWCSFS